MAQIKKRNYFDGSLKDFKLWLTKQDGATKLALVKSFTLIGVTNAEGVVDDGYIYARGSYYPLSVTGGSFDPTQYVKLLASDYDTATAANDNDIVTKGYLEQHTSFEEIG